MLAVLPHVCPVSGGAHHFELDEFDVPCCACGEVELSPVDQFEVVAAEMEGILNPLPPDVSERLYRRILESVERHERERGDG